MGIGIMVQIHYSRSRCKSGWQISINLHVDDTNKAYNHAALKAAYNHTSRMPYPAPSYQSIFPTSPNFQPPQEGLHIQCYHSIPATICREREASPSQFCPNIVLHLFWETSSDHCTCGIPCHPRVVEPQGARVIPCPGTEHALRVQVKTASYVLEKGKRWDLDEVLAME